MYALTAVERNFGVLEVQAPSVMNEYLNRPDLTAEKMRDGWVSTGDIVRRDSDGFFYFVGRSDDMFVCNGENVYPSDIERVLDQHKGIADSCVVAVESVKHGEMPVAFVVIRSDVKVDEQEIKQFVLDHGEANLHPRHVFVVDELPLASTNKVDRHSLKQIAAKNIRAQSV